ncbi:hypothetical protein V5R04_14145 [Jonesiaceae bacterium BS-20]|uniref:Uncharacterized protein n=1 Tax=Jonesiaceae bacterium BS-20 TaxID=3120821 RepID=A0AAU7DVV6_9MICO
MNSNNAAEPVTIQLFPDYAGTTLWLSDAIDYQESGLSPGLIQDLQVWEQSYYDSINLDNDHEWKSLGLANAYTKRGNELGQRVADEIGPDFEVDFSSYQQGVETRTFRAGGSANNADAALAFEHIATVRAEHEQDYKRLIEEAEAAGDTGWFAYAPVSGEVFAPDVPVTTTSDSGPASSPGAATILDALVQETRE